MEVQLRERPYKARDFKRTGGRVCVTPTADWPRGRTFDKERQTETWRAPDSPGELSSAQKNPRQRRRARESHTAGKARRAWESPRPSRAKEIAREPYLCILSSLCAWRFLPSARKIIICRLFKKLHLHKLCCSHKF